MSENPYHDESNIADEFKNLGKNIGDLLKTAWDNPERKRVQQEIENGFNDLANTLKREAEIFSESQTGQRLKSDVEDLGERLRNAEAREKLRQEVLGILQTANTELQKVVDKWSFEDQGKNAGVENTEPPVPEHPEQGE